MADRSIIAWTDNTFNGAMGCMKISPGCKNCYAETLTTNRMGLHLWGPASTTRRQITSDSIWLRPRVWVREALADNDPSKCQSCKRKDIEHVVGGVRGDQAHGRRLVFCGSLFDWAEDHPDLVPMRVRLWDLIRSTPTLDWQLLTKRADRIAELLPDDWGAHGYPNVWLGTSIENADYAWRADHLRNIPAVVRFVSYEPALGPLAGNLDLTGLDWIIYGGESGPGYRQHELEWPRDMRDACDAAGVTWFYKQSAAYRTEMGITLDGAMRRAWPVPRSVPSSSRVQTVATVAPAQGALNLG